MNTQTPSTPDQIKAMRSADLRLQQALSASKTPSFHAEAYKLYYYERYTKLGFEALPGTQGIYHLTDFASSVSRAAGIQANGDDVGIESKKARAKAAISILAKALGFRHARGSECLWEALEVSGNSAMHAAFHDLQSTFSSAAHDSMDHAFNTGSHVDIAKVIWFFIEELENLTGWLEVVGTAASEARNETILQAITKASKTLRDYENLLKKHGHGHGHGRGRGRGRMLC